VRPVKELKGYKKVSLNPGESTVVTFAITEESLKFWSAKGQHEAEDGTFNVWVSDSSNLNEATKITYSSKK
jgi:beta-glucosidase